MMKRAKFDFKVPRRIEEMIDELEKAVNEKSLHCDLYQDEIRSLAHGCTDTEITEDQAEEIIDYYCRTRFV